MNLKFKIFEPYIKEVDCGVTTNPITRPIRANQVHGDVVLDLKTPPTSVRDCDGFITQKSDLPIMVRVADCQGILLYDPITKTIAVIHSGWKGSIKNILGKTIQKMEKKYNAEPQNLIMGISPSLRQCCAEFSDPLNELPAFCHKHINGKNVDFVGLSIKQATLEGILKENIEVMDACTKCEDGYYSHRNGQKERMAVYIELK